jgi:predicted nucleotidyltransferase
MKDKAIKILLKIDEKNDYFQAIYLWGSILTDEFNPKSSDIDVIAIVDEDTPISNKELVNRLIAKKLPNMKINFLYPSELNGGSTKDTLARFIPVECIIYDMSSWIHVAGKQFQKTDFSAGRKTIDEVIISNINQIRSRFLPRVNNNDEIYFVKALAKLCYFISQKSHSFKPFRYHDLVTNATDQTQIICVAIVKIKDSGWDQKLMISYISEFQKFVSKI